MSLIEIKVPDIGDFAEATVIELLVRPGDTVKAEQSLITVESDKASTKIPSNHADVLKQLRLALGDKVKEDSLVLMLEWKWLMWLVLPQCQRLALPFHTQFRL